MKNSENPSAVVPHELTDQEIEELNAYGPYNHAVWKGRGVVISHEESLSGRAQFLASLFRRVLVSAFSAEEMAELTIVDVGCYDGWLLDQLSDLPFKKLVGIEPRQRNIDKGNKAREILHLHSRVEFRVGSIESLGTEVFDVVLCTGLLHHLESVGEALRALGSICKRKLFIETMCLSSRHITPEFVTELELKDIVYFGAKPLCGLSGHKFESAYYHGSAMRPGIVTIPTLSTLKMFLEQMGIRRIEVLAEPGKYWSGTVKRPAPACCLVADFPPEKEAAPQTDGIFQYENGLVQTLLPASLIEPLYERFCREQRGKEPWAVRWIAVYIEGPDLISRRVLLPWIRHRWPNRFEWEIIKNFRYAPADKIALEAAKLRYAKGDYSGAIEVARSIAHRLNADWRATYRAFLLMSRAYRRLGDSANAKRYEELCRVSNPAFPETLLAGA
jgi:2-polyprenyl-3-methyl-5-hydroxy-6-metoxy-1,4-benzoquinol methylase